MARSKAKNRHHRPGHPPGSPQPPPKTAVVPPANVPTAAAPLELAPTAPADPKPPIIPPPVDARPATAGSPQALSGDEVIPGAPPGAVLKETSAARESAARESSSARIQHPTDVAVGHRVMNRLDAMVSLLREQIDEHCAQLDTLSQTRQGVEQRLRLCEQRERELESAQQRYQRRLGLLRLWVRRLRELRDRTRNQRRNLADKIRTQRRQSPSPTQIAELSAQLQAARGELVELANQRMQAAAYAEELAAKLASETHARFEAESRVQGASEELHGLLSVVEELKNCSVAAAAVQPVDPEIMQQLHDARVACEDLRAQNQDLAAQLARLEVRRADTSGQCPAESMSWEQRKAAMLLRLEEEDDQAAEESGLNEGKSERDAMRLWVERTDHELTRKDNEIEELKRLLSEQSGAMGGVAVGAAAFAQMLDSDELVREEREKLREMQQQWEDKLRQAEIELSLERARLARERMELEQNSDDLRRRLQDIEQQKSWNPPTDAATGNKPPMRRWLAQLGLNKE